MNQTDNHAVAQAVHDLGSALWFGGTVLGVAGVNKSGADLQQGIDRIRVASSAWTRFAPAQWAGIGATMLAGLQLTRVGGRRMALQQGFGSVVALKAGITVPTEQTPPELATRQRRQRVALSAVPLLAGANIACGSYLVQSYRFGTTAKGVLRRLLPS